MIGFAASASDYMSASRLKTFDEGKRPLCTLSMIDSVIYFKQPEIHFADKDTFYSLPFYHLFNREML